MAKKNSIGATIYLGGEKEYRQAISKINAEQKLFTAELKKAAAEFAGNEKGLKSLKAQTAIAADATAKQEEKVRTLRGAVEEATKKYGENSTQVTKWKTSLANAETELAKMKKGFKDLKEESSGLKGATNGLKSVEEKFKDINSGGKIGKIKDDVKGFVKELGNVVKETPGLKQTVTVLKNVGSAAASVAKVSFKAMAAGVTAVGTAAVAAGKKVWDMSNQAAQAGDVIDKQSQKMSMSAEEYQKLAYAANLSGTNMNTMQRAQKALLSSGSKIPLTEALKQCANSSDVAAAATEMFGAKTAQELLPMLNQGAKGIDEMLNNADKYGQVMSNDAVKASAKFQDSLATLTGTAKNLKNNLVAELLPGITTVMDGFTGLLTGVEGSDKKIKDGVSSLVTSFKEVVPKITGIIGEMLPTVSAIAPDIINALVGGIVDNLSPLLDAAVSITSSLVSAILEPETLTKIVDASVGLVISLTDALIDNLDPLIDGAFTVVTSLADALLEDDNLSKLIGAAVDFTVTLTTGLLDHIPDLINAGLQLVGGLVKGLWDNRGKIVTAIKDIAKQLINTIKEKLGIHSPSTIFKDIGLNVIKGLINGLDNAKQWVYDKIHSIGKGIISKAERVLEINSPSKVFKRLGDFTGQGYGIGFVDRMKTVKKDIEKALPTDIKSTIGVKLQNATAKAAGIASEVLSSAPSRAESGGKTFNFNVTVNIDGKTAENSNLDELAEQIGEKLFRQFKKRTEAFA